MVIKKNFLLVIAVVSNCAILGCSDKSGSLEEPIKSDASSSIEESVESGASAYINKNLLEDAIDPFTGSREKWSQFTDNGGLNSINDFYGIPVDGINVQWKDGKTVRLALMHVSKAVAPKKIRDALNQACKTNESDWEKEDGALTRGEVHNGKVKCDYLTNDDASEIEVAITIEDTP